MLNFQLFFIILGMENLLEISANNLTKLHHINSSAFSPTPNLRKLSLSHNPSLQDIASDAFSFKESLEELYLNNNNLSTLPSNLVTWHHLTSFDLTDNPLTCTCHLYEIASNLPASITRSSNGPICFDPYTDSTTSMYTLDEGTCERKALPSRKLRILRHHFSVPLAGLVTILMVGLFVAVGLGYTRYRRFLLGTRDPYTSQVIYRPLFNHV